MCCACIFECSTSNFKHEEILTNCIQESFIRNCFLQEGRIKGWRLYFFVNKFILIITIGFKLILITINTFSYETTDGQKRNEIGTFVKSSTGDNEKVLKVIGTYSYLKEDGARYTVDYTSGEQGYHAKQV